MGMKEKAYKILIANNSLAACKFIASMKKTKHNILFYGLATKEDLDSLYILNLSSFELLESGPASVNYCNIDAIIKVAKKFEVDYVWPGWGFLSEDSTFSRQLEDNNIGFIGPSEYAMLTLGDKWKSTELCKSLGVPTIPSMNLVQSNDSKLVKSIPSDKNYNKILLKMINKLSLLDKYSIYNEYKSLDLEKKTQLKKYIDLKHKDGLTAAINIMELSQENFEYILKSFSVLKKLYDHEKIKKIDKVQNKTIDFERVAADNHRTDIAQDSILGKEDEISTDIGSKNISANKNQISLINSKAKEDASIEEKIKSFVSEYKFPILLKTSNSGGGKGIRDIRNVNELKIALDTVKDEGFGDVMICKSIQNARHIELQMASDKYSNVICLGGRDCTLQRRNQKLLEESLDEEDCKFYAKMKEGAEKIMKSVDYSGVATVEFLVTDTNYYFLEVNTRIQVEHPVTELKYNVNIPELQFLIAQGQSLDGFKHKKSKKHVLAIRTVAENVYENFLPVTGDFTLCMPCVYDCFAYFAKTKGRITEHNDSQFGHIFVKSSTRAKAAIKMIKVLENIFVSGICTNIAFMIRVLKSEFFISNDYNTRTIESLMTKNTKNSNGLSLFDVQNKSLHDPAVTFAAIMAIYSKENHGTIDFLHSEMTHLVSFYKSSDNKLFLEMNGTVCKVKYHVGVNIIHVFYNNMCDSLEYTQKNDCFCVYSKSGMSKFYMNYNNTHLITPTDGKIIRFCKEDNEHIEKNEDVVEIEIMKMLVMIKSNHSGTIKKAKMVNSFVNCGDIIADIINDDFVSYKKNLSGFLSNFSFQRTIETGKYVSYFINFFKDYDFPSAFFEEFEKAKDLDINMLLKIFMCYKNNQNKTEKHRKALLLVIHKIIENLRHFDRINKGLPLIEVIQSIDDYIITLHFDKPIFDQLVRLKTFFSEYKFKKLNFYNIGSVKDEDFESYLRKNCNYKEGILFAIKHITTHGNILVKKYLENHLGKKFSDYKVFDVRDGVCFQSQGFKCLFFVCRNNCKIYEQYDLILHYDCQNEKNTTHLYLEIHEQSPFVTYYYNKKSYICDSIIEKIMTKYNFEENNLVFKDIFRNLCIYKRNSTFNIIYKIDTHSGNSILDVKNISHAIKQVLCSIIIMYKKHGIDKSKFEICVEGKIKIKNEFVDRITDDLIFYYSKDYVRNGVLECTITYENDNRNKIVYSKYKGFLEKIVYENEKPKRYYVESKLVLHKEDLEELFDRGGVKAVNLTSENHNNVRETRKLVLSSCNSTKSEETAVIKELAATNKPAASVQSTDLKHSTAPKKSTEARECNLTLFPLDTVDRAKARKQNSITIDDFLSLFYLHKCYMKKSLAITERFLCKCNVNHKGSDALNVQDDWYTLCSMKGSKIGMRGFVINYDGMEFIVVMNDISFCNGSFSIEEDIFYTLMIRQARKAVIPFVNISCNSGARIGLYENVKKNIVLNDDFYYIKGMEGVLQNTPTENQKQPETISVYGNNSTGSENLSFSGLIAKETYFGYRDTLTISYVTGISVGIGAYINKLGQRIIQKHDSSIILTGYQALNTLLQSSIYKSNNDMGGKEIMTTNGNTHLIVQNDFEGVSEIIDWIDFFYNSRTKRNVVKGPVKRVDLSKTKTIADKTRVFTEMYNDTKVKNERLNESEIIERIADCDTFKQYKKGYGTSVIVGRAKIHGVSVGLISCNNGAVKNSKNVLDVEGSNKIAQSISDFSKEGLDIVILANFKGFSGGQEEMKNNILKEGSLIVEKLAECKTRVLIYVIPQGEVRGGSWVVFDKEINDNILIAAHPHSEVGILQPDALSKLKFKESERKEIFERYKKEYTAEMGQKLATEICRLHDNCYRLYLKGYIDDIVSLDNLKEYIYQNILL